VQRQYLLLLGIATQYPDLSFRESELSEVRFSGFCRGFA
jgi:hypothetical protein